eukprot:CAMPEP_0194206332 /NCGR_PEP_ID=MMETSP0156-20130528/5390_1 /TAXON_ID=33649 /ORGANISM="Thalassionema nitzschioides, Strain L26-B" /LENGTH=240 /DNA_ID=CAMNT_0038932825 /DNA_START=79 /DNA_END=801 /DNA_ORIENTATION=+
MTTTSTSSIGDDTLADYDDADVPIVSSASAPAEDKFSTIPEGIASKGVDDNNCFQTDDSLQDTKDDNPQELSQLNDDDDDREMACTIASIVLGSWYWGPMGGTVAGAGSAYALQTKGLVGDMARAFGDVALLASHKAVEINAKHQLVQRSQASLYQAWESMKDYDRRFRIVEKTKLFLVKSWNETVDYARRQQLMEKGMEASAKGLEWLLDQLDQIIVPNDNRENDSNEVEIQTLSMSPQ